MLSALEKGVRMRRYLIAAVLALLPLLSTVPARAQGEVQALVDRSTLTLEGMMAPGASQNAESMLQKARAVLICPRVFKAGFIFGGSGGDCVLVARAANGTWSDPAFFAIGSASVGLQLGLKDSELVLMVMTDKGLNALLASHIKLGADASVAIATIGGGVEGATTTAVGADILAYSRSRGAFAGLSIEGSVLSARPTWDQVYYGRAVDTRAIVIQMAASNPGADPLRSLLTRYGSGQPAMPPPGPSAAGYGAAPPTYAGPGAAQPIYGQPGTQPGYPAPPSATQPAPLEPSGPIQQQSLPPPSR